MKLFLSLLCVLYKYSAKNAYACKNTSLLHLVQMKSTFLRDNEMQNSEYLCNFAPPHLFHILGPFYIDGGVYVTTHDVIVDFGL